MKTVGWTVAILAVAGVAGAVMTLPAQGPRSQAAAPARITVVDDIDRSVELPHPVRRAVVLTRTIAELMRAVGGEETIVGMTGGGRNLFADLDIADYRGQGSVHGVSVDPEAILLRNPDAVVKIEPGTNPDTYLPPSQAELKATFDSLASRPGWGRLSAVAHGRVLVISNFAANTSGKMLGSVYVAKAAYPELMKDVDPDRLMRTWLEEFQRVPALGPYHHVSSRQP